MSILRWQSSAKSGRLENKNARKYPVFKFLAKTFHINVTYPGARSSPGSDRAILGSAPGKPKTIEITPLNLGGTVSEPPRIDI
jgi:hypothetical protein